MTNPPQPRQPAPRPDRPAVGGGVVGMPRRQRAHRDPLLRARPSARMSERHLGLLAARLTDRDRWLIAMLHEHHVLTTHAIAHMAFTSDHRTRRRLLQLHRWDVLDRFTPRLPHGAAPTHHVLGPAGAAVLAAQHGLAPAALRYRRDTTLAIAHHHTLAHTIAVNDLFAHLIHHSHHPTRGQPFRLQHWWSPTRCRRALDHVRPDAYARITTPSPRGNNSGNDNGRDGGGRVFEWFLELDMGTSTLDTLAAKLDRYARQADTTQPRPLLIWLPTPTREAHARTRLTHTLTTLDPRLLPIATSSAPIATRPHAGDTVDGGHGPAGRVWLPLGAGHPTQRADLADLAHYWPTPPGHSLVDELPDLAHPTGLADDDDEPAGSVGAGWGGLGAPCPLPPPPDPPPPRRRRS